MPFQLADFEAEFGPKLRDTRRWEGFHYIASRLAPMDRPLIIETGCLRSENDWAGNGQSTLLWSWMAQHGAQVGSVDIDEQNVRFARQRCPGVYVQFSDSIEFLSVLQEPNRIDLLYLDSYDHDPPYGPSELHGAGELACVWDKLKSGCMIAVDDCNGDGTGKHYLIRHFFDRMGIKPVVASYIHIWIKP